MMERVFYTSRIWTPILSLGVFAGLYGTFVSVNLLLAFPWDFPVLAPLLSVESLLVAAGSAFGLWQIRRPILSISEDGLEHRWIAIPGRKHLPADEVAGIAKTTARRIVLTTRRGGRLSIRLDSLPREERDDARAAIERWVAAHAPQVRP